MKWSRLFVRLVLGIFTVILSLSAWGMAWGMTNNVCDDGTCLGQAFLLMVVVGLDVLSLVAQTMVK